MESITKPDATHRQMAIVDFIVDIWCASFFRTYHNNIWVTAINDTIKRYIPKTIVHVAMRFRPNSDQKNIWQNPFLVDDEDIESYYFKTGTELVGSRVTAIGSRERSEITFDFDDVLVWTTQTAVFDRVGKRLVKDALKGTDQLLFSFGGPRSGKTFTMFGGKPDSYWPLHGAHRNLRGLIPRCCEYLFTSLSNGDQSEKQLLISVVELNGDNWMRDLLINQVKKFRNGCFLDLRFQPVTSLEDVLVFLRSAHLRFSRSTGRDKGHVLVMLKIVSITPDGVHRGRAVHITFADLSWWSGDRADDDIGVNRSLNTLEKVFRLSAAARCTSGRKKAPIGFRECALTYLFKDFISTKRNSRITCFVCASPAMIHLDDTLTSCRFSEHVKLLDDSMESFVKRRQEGLSDAPQNVSVRRRLAPQRTIPDGDASCISRMFW